MPIEAINGDADAINEKIKEDYRNGTSLEGFRENLDTRLRQAEDFDEIIKTEFTHGEHSLDKYLSWFVIIGAAKPLALAMGSVNEMDIVRTDGCVLPIHSMRKMNSLGTRLPLKFENS